MRGFAAMCLARFRRSLAAVYEVFKGSGALCARRNLFVGGGLLGIGDFLFGWGVEFFHMNVDTHGFDALFVVGLRDVIWIFFVL